MKPESTKENEMTTETITTNDMIVIAQEMEAAGLRYRDSAVRLLEMEGEQDWTNAISGQRQMSHWCLEVARKAKALRGFA